MSRVLHLAVFSLFTTLASLSNAGNVGEQDLVQFKANSKAVADEVNSNFNRLKNAVNDNDQRLRDAEAVIAAPTFGYSSLAPLNKPEQAATSCQAIAKAGLSHGDGIYWIDPDGTGANNAFRAFCEMTTLSGGWALVMNVEPADGNIVSFTNTRFWQDNAEWGQIENHFTHDYKSPAAWLLAGTNILIQVANPGPLGRVIGWKAWAMGAKSFDTFFDSANSTEQTTEVIGVDVDAVYPYEPLIKNGTQLRSNLSINFNGDRVRLGVDKYDAQGDDNQPGLGTQMNSTHSSCGYSPNGCWRYRDVELWVNSKTNVWSSAPAEGTYKWIGTDGGCGTLCGVEDNISGPGYSPFWTYRIFVR